MMLLNIHKAAELVGLPSRGGEESRNERKEGISQTELAQLINLSASTRRQEKPQAYMI